MQGEKFRRGLDFDHNFLDKEVRFPASAARFGRRFLRCGKYGVKNGFRFYIRVRARGATEGRPRRQQSPDGKIRRPEPARASAAGCLFFRTMTIRQSNSWLAPGIHRFRGQWLRFCSVSVRFRQVMVSFSWVCIRFRLLMVRFL